MLLLWIVDETRNNEARRDAGLAIAGAVAGFCPAAC